MRMCRLLLLDLLSLCSAGYTQIVTLGSKVVVAAFSHPSQEHTYKELPSVRTAKP